MLRKEALKIAQTIKNQLAPFSKRIEICGPLRRAEPEVKNVQLIVQPRKQMVTISRKINGTEHFQDVEIPVAGFNQVISQYPSIFGKISEGGKSQQFMLSSGGKFDLFTAESRNWGYLLMCRTGSEDFFRKFMLRRLKIKGYKCEDGYIWRKNELIETPEESDVFQLMETKYLPPSERNGRLN